MYICKTILIIIFGFNHLTLFAKSDPKKIPATSQGITIKVGTDSIAAFGLFAEGEAKKETVILLHGLPGHERNLDVAQELRRNGKNVIYFNYRGAWGSQGEFLYSNCIEDVSRVIDFLSTPHYAEKYRVKLNSFILFGHSMGGGIALLSGANDQRVTKIAVYSPYLMDDATDDGLNNARSYFESFFMLNIHFPNFKQDILSNKDKLKVLNFKERLSSKHLIILDENERDKNWIGQLNNVEYILMKTDHSFSDKRLELIDTMIKWINL